MAVLTTGRLAALSGVNTETLRYYERCGLLLAPERTLRIQELPCGEVKDKACNKIEAKVSQLKSMLTALRRVVEMSG